MTQAELIEQIAKRSGLRRKSVQAFLTAFYDIVGEELARGEAVRLRSFGTFLPVVWPHQRRWHVGRKELIATSARVIPRFRPGRPLRELIAQKLVAMQLPNGRFIIKPREPEGSVASKR
ncbi:MAG: HU family DNA-binding protein [Candidatus Bipolaricaulota bacterium]|nr:HU family DNA-binding protein [Candidatus Bipolaricaulota bacterium]MCS7273912.1 HU family DNA-binding protein [Candidatus Bipolaricaulota bacterium]MDW8110801.1 HU family DNA-binding protein [Candidatus Bipolaricaulota bacterium]MDW8328718.1 HU family DNA-binding protein [Candidatus Bipolaricaulota bacterium]